MINLHIDYRGIKPIQKNPSHRFETEMKSWNIMPNIITGT
jgi:hypothetical protein